MITKFIINTITDGNEPPRARHQVAQALSAKYEVIFISANRRGLPALDTNFINKNLTVITPVFPIDFRIRYRLPVINEIYQLWLFNSLLKKYKEYILINFDFTAYLIHRFSKKVIYYCNDNFLSISKKINIWPVFIYHSICERKMIGLSKICIGTSKIITDNLLKFNKISFEIQLGGPDVDEYAIEPAPLNNKLRPLNIGLVGFIKHYNISVQLVNDIILKTNCKITLIGPLEPSFYEEICDKSRVNHKGVLMGENLLHEINKFDVAIAPYLRKKTNEGGIPNKLLFYLALGKPVVMTKLLSMKELKLDDKLIYEVDVDQEFPMMILKAHKENNSMLINKRINYAKGNTWGKKMDQFIEIINNKL